MKNLLYLILIACLCSCGIFRKSSKDKVLTSNQVTTTKEVKSSELITDKSKITIREKADTSVVTPAKVTVGISKIGMNIDSLVNGLTAISNDLLDVKLVLDSNGVLTTTALIKAQKVPFHFDRETTIDKDVTGRKDIDSKDKSNSKASSKIVKKESEPTSIGLWAWLGMGVIAGIVLYFIIKK